MMHANIKALEQHAKLATVFLAISTPVMTGEVAFGVDFTARLGTKVVATADGKVAVAGLQTGRKPKAARRTVHRVAWMGSCNRPVHIPVEYSRMLREATGSNGANWLNFVRRSVDRIDFIPSHILVLSDGRRAVGVAAVVRGCRRALVATRGRRPIDIAKTIVQEAAHLSTYQRTGRFRTEAKAVETEAWFLTHWRNARRLRRRNAQARKAQQEKEIKGRQRLESTAASLARLAQQIQDTQNELIRALKRIEARLGRVEGALNRPGLGGPIEARVVRGEGRPREGVEDHGQTQRRNHYGGRKALEKSRIIRSGSRSRKCQPETDY